MRSVMASPAQGDLVFLTVDLRPARATHLLKEYMMGWVYNLITATPFTALFRLKLLGAPFRFLGWFGKH